MRWQLEVLFRRQGDLPHPKSMCGVFVYHMTRMRQNRLVPRQKLQAVVLPLVLTYHGEGTPPAAPTRIVPEKARPSEPAIARPDRRTLERLSSADARAVIRMEEEDRRREVQDLRF